MRLISVKQGLTSYFLAAEGGWGKTVGGLFSDDPAVVGIAIGCIALACFCCCCKMAMKMSSDSDSKPSQAEARSSISRNSLPRMNTAAWYVVRQTQNGSQIYPV